MMATKAKAESARPLAGRRVIVSRARGQAGSLSAELQRLGAEVEEIPFIEIRPPASFAPLDAALAAHRSYDWLILTSANGVQALGGRLAGLKLTGSDLLHLKLAAIGPATRRAAEALGLRVDVMPEEYVAEAVVSALRAEVAGKRVLLVRAKVARDVIPQELRRAGAEVDVREAYETVAPVSSRAALRAVLGGARRPDVITFTSSSTARNLLALLAPGAAVADEAVRRMLAGVALASIGPVTSATLHEIGLPPQIEAAEYTIPGLVRAMVARYRPKG
jgi:uroporphyrinogen-III synthase